MKVTLISSIIILFLSCNSEEKTEKNKPVTELGHNVATVDSISAGQSQFLDSVSKQFELSIEQIKKYTIIDSLYYTGIYSGAVFTGDTVWNLGNNVRAAIIHYSDMIVCSYKFIITFIPGYLRSADAKRILVDCDRDEGGAYRTLEYTIISGSSFETVETYVSAASNNAGSDTAIQWIKWAINGKGIIDTAIYKNNH